MTDDTEADIHQNHVKFPRHLALIDDVFRFRHDAANDISDRVHTVDDVLALLRQAAQDIAASPLSDEEKAIVQGLLEEEEKVIGFSTSARASIISL